jgi:hypothetical protein
MSPRAAQDILGKKKCLAAEEIRITHRPTHSVVIIPTRLPANLLSSVSLN